MSANSPGQAGLCLVLNRRSTLSGQLVPANAEFSKPKHGIHKQRVYVLCGLVLCLLISPSIQAAFIGGYALNNFAISNSDGVGGLSGTDGFALSPDSGLSVILTGGNSGSGLAGVTNLVINALASGLVHFQYSYASFDIPGLDAAGYLIGNQFFPLSDSDGVCNAGPCPAVAQFNVTIGQSFGFRISTADNQGEPGSLTISDFTAPGATLALPEPGTAPLLLLLFGALIARLRAVRVRGKA